ncbi:MAG TPA: hypothetical protein P5114_01815 [Hyphomicrobiaceae bacterium]|nr:hypothetical protein [Hyphomicrobiaceae bacterium]
MRAVLLMLALAALALLAGLSTSARAAQDYVSTNLPSLSLVMIEAEGCGYCRKWHEEVGPGYPLSDEGHRAPLVRIDRKSKEAERFTRVVFTPTFILIGQGTELGRINGYPGPDFFWSMLADMLRKLDEAAQPVSAARH